MKNSWISVNNKDIFPKVSMQNVCTGIDVSEDILVTDGKNIKIGYVVFEVDNNPDLCRNKWCFYELEEDDWIGEITHWQPLETPE